MIRCGDAVDLLREIPDDGVDVTITDPPYSDHVHANHWVGGNPVKGKPSKRTKAKPTKKDLGFSSLSRPLRAQIAHELARVTKRWVLVFSDHEGSVDWGRDLAYAGLQIVRYGIWRKKGAPPQFTGDRPGVGHEVIVIAHRPPPGNKKQWNGGGHHGVWTHQISRGKNRVHTTQKPDPLCDELVGLFSNPGELILDPFAGSGAILAAAARAGRRPYGIEIDPGYAAGAATLVHNAIQAYDPRPALSDEPATGKPGGGGKGDPSGEDRKDGPGSVPPLDDPNQLDWVKEAESRPKRKRKKAKR